MHKGGVVVVLHAGELRCGPSEAPDHGFSGNVIELLALSGLAKIKRRTLCGPSREKANVTLTPARSQ